MHPDLYTITRANGRYFLKSSQYSENGFDNLRGLFEGNITIIIHYVSLNYVFFNYMYNIVS